MGDSMRGHDGDVCTSTPCRTHPPQPASDEADPEVMDGYLHQSISHQNRHVALHGAKTHWNFLAGALVGAP
eukprot:751395-Hanusia_phi.AAC.5